MDQIARIPNAGLEWLHIERLSPPVERIRRTTARQWEKARSRYGPMIDPGWWLHALSGQHMSRTQSIRGSANFRYRVMVISRFLSRGATRRPFELYR